MSMKPYSACTLPKRSRRLTSQEARYGEALIIIAGDMFAAGFDTKDISLRLVTPEHEVLAALQIARERQRMDAISGGVA